MSKFSDDLLIIIALFLVLAVLVLPFFIMFEYIDLSEIYTDSTSLPK